MKQLLLLFLLVGCSSETETTGTEQQEKDTATEETKTVEETKKTEIKRGTIEETARTFVQAMIDADEEVLNQIYRDPLDPLEYMLPDEGPNFAGLTLEDFSFLIEEDNEVQLERIDGEGPIYWLDIEMIGDEYFVTGM